MCGGFVIFVEGLLEVLLMCFECLNLVCVLCWVEYGKYCIDCEDESM